MQIQRKGFFRTHSNDSVKRLDPCEVGKLGLGSEVFEVLDDGRKHVENVGVALNPSTAIMLHSRPVAKMHAVKQTSCSCIVTILKS